MNYYERYAKLINNKKESGGLPQEFIKQTTERLNYYKTKKKITKAEYDELIALMNPNEE